MNALDAGLLCTLLLIGTVAALLGGMSAARRRRRASFALCLVAAAPDFARAVSAEGSAALAAFVKPSAPAGFLRETSAAWLTFSSCSTASTVRRSFFSSRFWRAQMPTTGTPRRAESCSKSIRMPRALASSIIFTQRITEGHSSMICSARLRLRVRQVASQTTITASGRSKHKKSRAAASSAERVSSE